MTTEPAGREDYAGLLAKLDEARLIYGRQSSELYKSNADDAKRQDLVKAHNAILEAHAAIIKLKQENTLNEELAHKAQVLASKWMEAHDKLKAGKPYAYPEPADLPNIIDRTWNAAIDKALVTLREAWHRHAPPFNRRVEAQEEMVADMLNSTFALRHAAEALRAYVKEG